MENEKGKLIVFKNHSPLLCWVAVESISLPLDWLTILQLTSRWISFDKISQQYLMIQCDNLPQILNFPWSSKMIFKLNSLNLKQEQLPLSFLVFNTCYMFLWSYMKLWRRNWKIKDKIFRFKCKNKKINSKLKST